MKKNILLSGLPKSGKTTLLKKLIVEFPDRVGFVTNEIRENGERTGFEIETSSDKRTLFASTTFLSGPRVGKYGVDVAALESNIPEVSKFNNSDVLFLDEIGQAELFSKNFRQLVQRYLDSPNLFIGTISEVYDDALIRQIREREDTAIIEISENTRDLAEARFRDCVFIHRSR